MAATNSDNDRRIDYVELRDRVDGGSSSVSAPFYVNGGRQVAYQGSLIWNPTFAFAERRIASSERRM